MKAIRIHAFGPSDQLAYEDAPLPEPKAGELRVKVAAAGLNFTEVYARKGLYPAPLPFTPGSEFAGTVDAVGPGVTDFKVGQPVATASGMGGYADFALAPAALTTAIPAGVSVEQAAAVMLQGMTAHYLAYSTFPLKPQDTALVHAGAGGVGLLLLQIGKMLGARLIATVSTAEKAELARKAGAAEVILYTEADFETEVMRLTGGRGVEVVYDGVGKTTFLKGLNVLKPRGYMVLYGQSSGPVDPINPQILNQKGSLFLTRPMLRAYLLSRAEFEWRTTDLFNWMASGKLDVRVDRTFPLAQAAAAHDYIEGRQTRGKVLITP